MNTNGARHFFQPWKWGILSKSPGYTIVEGKRWKIQHTDNPNYI